MGLRVKALCSSTHRNRFCWSFVSFEWLKNLYICLFTCASTCPVFELMAVLNVVLFLVYSEDSLDGVGYHTWYPIMLKHFDLNQGRYALLIVQSPEDLQYFSNHQITWQFIIQRASGKDSQKSKTSFEDNDRVCGECSTTNIRMLKMIRKAWVIA